MSPRKPLDENAGGRRKPGPRKSASGESASDKPKSGKIASNKSAKGKSGTRKTTAKKSTARKPRKTAATSKRSAEKTTTRKRASKKSVPPPEPPAPTSSEPTLPPAEAPTLPFPPTSTAPPPEKNETPYQPPSNSEPQLVSSLVEDLLQSLEDHKTPSVSTTIDESPELPELIRPIPPEAQRRHKFQDVFHRFRHWLALSQTKAIDGSLPHTHQEAWLIHPAALILGLAAGWQWAGMKMTLAATIDPSPATVTMLGAIALLMAAIGPRIPGRMVLGFVHIFGRRWQTASNNDARGNNTFWMLQAIRNRDESLLWLSFAVLCSAAGAVTLLTILLSTFATQFYHYLLEHFFWTPLTLAGLEWTSITLWMGGAWLMNGLAVSALASATAARTESRRSPPGIAAGLLMGLALAWLLHTTWADRGMSATQILLLGVLPMFALSAIAARLSQNAEKQQLTGWTPKLDLPELSGQAEGWIWLALVAWGIGSILAGSGWLACQWMLDPRQTKFWSQPSGYLLVLGFGVMLASFHARHRKQSASGCGMALWAAGVAVGLSALTSAFSFGGTAGRLFQMTTLALPIGYALHYVERAWLARVGSETLGFAQMMTALLGGCAISLIAAHWWVQPTLGPMGMMSAGSLAMLAYGGLVQIYEQNNSVHTQRLRLGLVFASLAAAIVLFPTIVAYWGAQARKATHADEMYTVPLTIPDLEHTRRICLIGLSDQTTIPTLKDYTGQVDLISFTHPDTMTAIPLLDTARSYKLTSGSCRALRLENRVYDLVYQHSPRACSLSRFAHYSIEWLTALARKTTSGGHVILDVPLADMTSEAIAVIGSTFQEAMGSSSVWRIIDSSDAPILRFKGRANLVEPDDRNLTAGWSPIASLLESQEHLDGPHSIRKDRVTGALEPNPVESPIILVDSLQGGK